MPRGATKKQVKLKIFWLTQREAGKKKKQEEKKIELIENIVKWETYIKLL